MDVNTVNTVETAAEETKATQAFWDVPGFKEKVRRGQLLRQVQADTDKLKALTAVAENNIIADAMQQNLWNTIAYREYQVKACEAVLKELGQMPEPKKAKVPLEAPEVAPMNV